MKEWKNNPESDEENTTDLKDNWSIQEKLKDYPPGSPSGNVQDISSTSDEEEEKQVGGTNKTSRKNNYPISPTCKILSQHLEQFLQLCLFLLLICKERPYMTKKVKFSPPLRLSWFSTAAYVFVLGSVITSGRGLQTFPIKEQRVDISGFVGHNSLSHNFSTLMLTVWK